jgi:VanZ family protein
VALIAWALVVAYASLYPFGPLRPPGPDALAVFLRPRVVLEFDMAVNVIAYAPLGALAALLFGAAAAPWRALVKAAIACAAFSLAMEACQLVVSYRVASIYDLGANTVGAALGALFLTPPLRGWMISPLASRRERIVIGGGWGDAGLMLLLLWLIAQLNPALPFFEAGNLVEEDGGAGSFATVAVAVALSVCAFGLFVSVMLKGPGGALRWTLLLLTVALWCKFAASSLFLRPQLAATWMSEGRITGLALGVVAFMPLRGLPRPARLYLAMVLLLAGALFAKIFGAYSPVADFLRLFSWPFGQLGNFATLTRWIHEIWPLLALLWLVALFVWRRNEPIQSAARTME